MRPTNKVFSERLILRLMKIGDIMNFNPIIVKPNGFDIVKEIKGMSLKQVWEFCEETGGELDLKKGIIKIARVYLYD